MKSEPKDHERSPALAAGPSVEGCRLAGRIWVQHGDETFLAWGRVVLLERIREYGSINAAAKSLGMGFRHAWLLVDQMNRLCPKPLVTKTTGGRGGGGTILTPEGERVVEAFWALAASFNEWLASQDPRLWNPRPAARSEKKPAKAAKAAVKKNTRVRKASKVDPGWRFP